MFTYGDQTRSPFACDSHITDEGCVKSAPLTTLTVLLHVEFHFNMQLTRKRFRAMTLRSVTMSERQLLSRDSQGHKRSFVMGDHDHLKFSTAFNDFIKKHVSQENTTFRLKRVHTGEARVVEKEFGIIGVEKAGNDPTTEYRRYARRTDGAELQLRFAFGGFDALVDHGPWTTDRELEKWS